MADYDHSFEDIRDVLRKSGLHGLVKIEKGELGFRSPAFAEFMLRKSVGIQRTLDAAQHALFRLDTIFGDDYEFDRVSRALLKYSLYGRIFKSSHIENQMEKFYDRCRTLGIAKRDPLFLVQRSITSMSAKLFTSSRIYISIPLTRWQKRRRTLIPTK